MTKFCHLICALSLALMAFNSCGEAAPPAKQLVPTQVLVPGQPVRAVGENSILIYGGNYYIAAGGVISPVPSSRVINLDGPGPTPGPPPQPPITERVRKYRDLAAVVPDPARAAHARKLSDAYRLVADGSYSSPAAIQDATIRAGTEAIDAANWNGAWKPFRDALSDEWNDTWQQNATPIPALSELLRDVSKGLSASIQ